MWTSFPISGGDTVFKRIEGAFSKYCEYRCMNLENSTGQCVIAADVEHERPILADTLTHGDRGAMDCKYKSCLDQQPAADWRLPSAPHLHPVSHGEEEGEINGDRERIQFFSQNHVQNKIVLLH